MAGTHFHHCTCGTIWEHSDDMAGNRDAHDCPDCGTRRTHRYWPKSSEIVKYPNPAPLFKDRTTDGTGQLNS